MPKIRVQIRKTNIEWSRIEETIQKKYADRNLTVTGKGYNQFISSEINKLFQNIEIGACLEDKVAHVKKDFSIILSDRTAKKVICTANKLGIDPGMLIARMILDPHLLEL